MSISSKKKPVAANQKLLVIGSNSFSGASFIAHALKKGWTVYGTSRSAEYPSCYLPYRWLNEDLQQRFEFSQRNIRENAAEIARIANENEIPYVVNFAALGMVAESWEYPVDYYATNLLGNVALHEELRKVESLKKYVHVSTPEVYGNTEGRIDESALLNPTTPYAASRAACDIHLRTFLEEYEFPVVWTRAANVYGPGQQPFRIIPRTILCKELGEKLLLHGGGQSVRSFIHIDDVAAATLRIMQDANPGERFHLSTDRYVSIKELAEIVCSQMNIELDNIAEIAPERPGKDHAYLLDSSFCRERFGWKDEIALEDGISETITWVNHWIEQLKELPLSYIHKA